MIALQKYPRTQHLEGSRWQPGDGDLDGVPFAHLAGRHLVVEEKLDGANAGLRFDEEGKLWLQSRGHFLTGGAREKHFNLFKQWAAAHASALWPVLGSRHIVFGEWLYAKHTIFYDRLPHYFLEFDVLDTATGTFLSTPRRRELLAGLPLVPVPVLHEGPVRTLAEVQAFVRPSLYKGPAWRERLNESAAEAGLSGERAWAETESSDLSEGLYIKVEEGGQVEGRYKYIRASFLTTVVDSSTHWLHRPIVPNRLADGVDLFGGAP
jgi:hypothetical protein